MLAVQTLLFLAFFYAGIHKIICSTTDPADLVVLKSIKNQWQNTPRSWTTPDPCGDHWQGVICNNARVTELQLKGLGLNGMLIGDIGDLTELTLLDLSHNPNLTGPLSPALGKLQKLNFLDLAGCRISGNIPEELGNLTELLSLSLYSNYLVGNIPRSLGKLSKLILLDLTDNQLSGPLPISTPESPGLDLLLKAEHFHLCKNQLSGSIPPNLFSSEMQLIHILFDQNQFSGKIPETLGLVKNLEILGLERNSLTGHIPTNLSNLRHLNQLSLAHNNLTGPLPNLTEMSSLSLVDLSNNSFDQSEAPDWFSSLLSLTTLIIEHGSMNGSLPQKIFKLPQIQQIKLKGNAFSGKLNMDAGISTQLQLVDLQNNGIQSLANSTSEYNNTLMLMGNPVCSQHSNSDASYCQLQQQPAKPYSTSLIKCESVLCPPDEKRNPQSCECSYPFEGILYLRASFRELSNETRFHLLEKKLLEGLQLNTGSVSIQNLSINKDDYLQMQIALFPPSGKCFDSSEIQRILSQLNPDSVQLPTEFGQFYFFPFHYYFSAAHRGTPSSNRLMVGIAIGCGFLILSLIGVGIYAIKQKKRRQKAIGLISWSSSGKDSGDGPQLKGSRSFSLDELKRYTNNFSKSNEIGRGGYGKVYKGVTRDGQIVAIKRGQQESMQGGLEFRTEIELLSRVHHKNLVGLVGFCFEQGEQMLVYEFMPNGTLRESLSGRSGIHLDWNRRLRIALGSAKGLVYLHELANPPIIHRDIKSTNILLDEYLDAKVADFGLSKLLFDSKDGHISTQIKGTRGYLDPEYYMMQQLTKKSDVYSFGVVLLELITAKQPMVKGKYIVREVLTLMDKSDKEHYGLREIMDVTIRYEITNAIGFGRFLELAIQCVQESATDRPTMSEVVKAIEAILQMMK